MKKVSILLFSCLYITIYAYSNEALSPTEGCCSNIGFNLKKQKKLLLEQVLPFQNSSLEANKVCNYLAELSGHVLTEEEKAPFVLKRGILELSESWIIILIPTLIPLFIFILGESIKWRSKQKSKQAEIREYRKIILGWVDLISHPVQEQVEACRKLAFDISNSPNIHPERMEYRKMLADKIDNIGLEKFISAFMINSTTPNKDALNKEMTFNLVSQFEFLKSIELNIQSRYKEYQIQTLALMDKWNDEFLRLQNLVKTWDDKLKGNPHPYSNFNDKVEQIYTSYTNKAKKEEADDNTIFILNNLISPLDMLVFNELNKSAPNFYALEMSSILQQFKIIEKKWNTTIKGYSNVFSGKADFIMKSYSSLKKAKEYFEKKTEVKSIMHI